MRNLLTVIKFTMKDMANRKSFIVSTIIILVLIVIGFNVPNIMKSISGEDTEAILLIVDNDNVFEGNLETLKQADLGYEVETSNNLTYDEVKVKIESKEVSEAIMIEKQDENVKIRYIVENATMMAQVPDNIVNMLSTLYFLNSISLS